MAAKQIISKGKNQYLELSWKNEVETKWFNRRGKMLSF